MTVGVWHNIIIRDFGNGTINFLLDGAPYANTMTGPRTMSGLNLKKICWFFGNKGNNCYDFKGILDEVCISNIARSDAWIKTEYNNQNNPFNFLSFGPEETP